MFRILVSLFFLPCFCIAVAAQEDGFECGDLSISSRPLINLGSESFSIKLVPDVDVSKLKIVWKVEKGLIVSGQGTKTLTINSLWPGDPVPRVSVEVTGPGECPKQSWIGHGIIIDPGSPVLVDEFGMVGVGELRTRVEKFVGNLSDDSTARLFLLTYGDEAEARDLHETVRRLFAQRKLEPDQFVIRFVEKERVLRNRLWVVPRGAKAPEIKEASFVYQIEDVSIEVVREHYRAFVAAIEKENPGAFGYIINYGTPDQITIREHLIREASVPIIRDEADRLMLVNGGPISGRDVKVRTRFWIVPAGADSSRIH